mmetsp:Transcript_1047/g.1290  ORF Transcript_1047/g.1290 Transcript_1047/m.1290 type:complete len:87 (+) Transcript_1047:570-830(+)
MIVTCLFFASSKQLTGTAQQEFDLPEGTTTKQFVDEYLLKQFPNLEKAIGTFLLSVNQEYVDQDSHEPVILTNRAEIAVIPPVSGG